MTLTLAVVLAGAAVVLGFAAYRFLRVFAEYRGKRLVTCPENAEAVAVNVEAGRAALSALSGKPALRLSDCSRWPEKAGCGQDCLEQVERSPADCLVKAVVARWYAGKACALCGKPFRDLHWDHRPALLSPRGETIQWHEVAPEQLLPMMESHAPVCWDCHVVETLMRQHPELPVIRPAHEPTSGAAAR